MRRQNEARPVSLIQPIKSQECNKRRISTILICLLSIFFTSACFLFPSQTLPTISPTETTKAVQPSATFTATQSPSPTATIQPTETQESECHKLNLTPQECANIGRHLYTLHGTVAGFCEYGTTEGTFAHVVTRDFFLTVTFFDSDSGRGVSVEDGVFITCEKAYQTGTNTYTYDCMNGGNREQGTITFLDNAILNDGGMSNSVNKNCTWEESYQMN